MVIFGNCCCSHLHCSGVSATLLSGGIFPSLINAIFILSMPVQLSLKLILEKLLEKICECRCSFGFYKDNEKTFDCINGFGKEGIAAPQKLLQIGNFFVLV